MPDAQNRTTEAELSAVVLEILYMSPSGRASVQQLIAEIPRRLALTLEDQVQSDTRPNEEVWEQRVRNIRSHHNTAGNYIAEGLLAAVDGGYEITAMGRQRIENRMAK